jgi:transposase
MSSSSSSRADQARVKRPQREQIEWRPASLDQLIPADHRVRAVWAYVEGLDLSPLYQTIRAVEGHVGRDAVDPRILMALWMFATIEGLGSARHLARLCTRDLAYLWICGGVGVNHHLLSDFRTAHGAFLDQLLTDTIATLLHRQIVTLQAVAQDGMRVRASAGTSSFRREPTLQACREKAAEQVRRLREEDSGEDGSGSDQSRRKAAQARAARERLERVEAALADLRELREQKEARKKGSGEQARCSTTDPQARRMKMADGGFRPAYNVQFATDAASRMIVAVEVTNNGSDGGQMAPLHENVCRRYGAVPGNYLVDGGFATKDDITAVERRGTQVFAPILQEEEMRKRGTDPHARQPRDSDEMFAFRQRMATEAAKATYQQRPSVAEYPNAECRNRGLGQFRVRGREKVRTVSLWYALTFNFLRMVRLGCLGPPALGLS